MSVSQGKREWQVCSRHASLTEGHSIIMSSVQQCQARSQAGGRLG